MFTEKNLFFLHCSFHLNCHLPLLLLCFSLLIFLKYLLVIGCAFPLKHEGNWKPHFWVFIYLLFFFFYFTILYWFCHTSTWIHHGYTRVPNPEPPSHLPPHTIPLGHPSAPAPSILYHASNLDWRFISHILYMFQCHSPKSSHPCPLPQRPKDYSIHLYLFCCPEYRVIVTIFLNYIYMC